MTFPDSYCRKCHGKNNVVFFAPVFVAGMDARDSSRHDVGVGTHICLSCAIAHGFANSRGELKAGVSL
jgi:hypothetical protein